MEVVKIPKYEPIFGPMYFTIRRNKQESEEWFTTIDKILFFINLDDFCDKIYLTEVYLATNKPKIIKNDNRFLADTNTICYGESYSLLQSATYKKFFLDYPNIKWIIHASIKNNSTELLNLLHLNNKNRFLNVLGEVLRIASEYGFVEILDWYASLNIPFWCTPDIIDSASANGHAKILQWWKEWASKTRNEFKYTSKAIDLATINGHVDVLDWWLKSGFNLLYTCRAMDESGNTGVLDWWLKSGLVLIYSEQAMTYASKYGNVEILDWWAQSGLELKYDNNTIHIAFDHGQIKSVQWWFDSNLPFKYSASLLSTVSFKGHISLLNWLRESRSKYQLRLEIPLFPLKWKNPDVDNWWNEFRSSL